MKTELLVKIFMTIMGMFFGYISFVFATKLHETTIYVNFITKVLVFVGLLIMMTLCFCVSHLYKED
jgi:hypothetical protein